jgi:hypothetical protein
MVRSRWGFVVGAAALLAGIQAPANGLGIAPAQGPVSADRVVVVSQAATPTGGVRITYLRPDGTTATAGWEPTSIAPLSAFGCNGNVCIDVQGTGNTVVDWGTKAIGNVGCQRAYFQFKVPYASWQSHEGPSICPKDSRQGVYYDYTGPTGWFANNTQLCNVWSKSSGRPCETVQS